MRLLKIIAEQKLECSDLNVRKLSHICVQGVERLVIDVLVVVQPQSIRVLNTPTHTETHSTSQLGTNDR